jgi:hypothetical protein
VVPVVRLTSSLLPVEVANYSTIGEAGIPAEGNRFFDHSGRLLACLRRPPT